VRARAALFPSLVADLVSDLEQRRQMFGQSAVHLQVSGRGNLDGSGHVVELVAAAALRLRGTASGSGSGVALQRALGLGAGGGLAARPGALGSRAGRAAVGNSRSANSLALGRQADVLAQRAATSLAVLAGAAHLALGLLAADIAGGLTELLAAELAGGLLALRLADGGAGRSVAAPLAVREAVALSSGLEERRTSSVGERHVLSRRSSDGQETDNEDSLHLPSD